MIVPGFSQNLAGFNLESSLLCQFDCLLDFHAVHVAIISARNANMVGDAENAARLKQALYL
jgi:hypothetical protein